MDKKPLLISSGIVLVAAGAYLLIRRSRRPAPAPSPRPGPVPVPQPPPAPAPAPSLFPSEIPAVPMPVLSAGSRSSYVSLLQARLRDLGFDPGYVDGIFGPRTEGAVKSFQEWYGLAADGVVGRKTWDALILSQPALPVLAKGSTGHYVRFLQARLKDLGFDPVYADGAFGPLTEAALKSFQQAASLPMSGTVDILTWHALTDTRVEMM